MNENSSPLPASTPPGRYVHLRAPWRAVVDTRTPEPARFLVRLAADALRYGLPARRYGPAGALLAGLPVPAAPIAAALRRLRPREHPELDRLVLDTHAAWPALAARGERLPADPPALAALALDRSAGTTVLLFGREEHPLLVLKTGEGPAAGRLENEVAALRMAEPVAVAPRWLGHVGRATVQEGVPGSPLRVDPVTPANAGSAPWSDGLAATADALVRISAATAARHPSDPLGPVLDAALDGAGLPAGTARAAAAAARDVRRLAVRVLRHGDVAAQNCLVGPAGVRLVDWEFADPHGLPTFDLWNLAVTHLEHGVGLRRWDERRALASLQAAWPDSALIRETRRHAERALDAAGAPSDAAEPLEISFLTARVGRRLLDARGHTVSVGTAAAMLEWRCSG